MDVKQINLANLSKPIKLGPQKNDLWSRFNRWLESNGKINIFFKQKDDHSHAENTDSNKQNTEKAGLAENIDEEFIDKEMSKTHSSITNSKLAEKFFSAATKQDKKENNSWLSPGGGAILENEIFRGKSIAWLIGGAISLLVIIILLFASFGLINLIKEKLFNRPLTEIELAFKQAQDFYNQNSFEPAKTKVDEILAMSPDYQPALDLLTKVNQKRGELLLNNFDIAHEPDFTVAPEQEYLDPDNHYKIMLPTGWEKIESNADLKLVSGDSSLTVKKYPKANYLQKVEELFKTDLDQKTTILATKSDINFKNNQSEIIALEQDNFYQITVLMQKYYFGYELSILVPKKDFSQNQTVFKQFVQSFALLPEFDLESYDQLTTFESANFIFHGWASLTPEDQSFIQENFQNALKSINDKMLINWKEKINVYLYPSWDKVKIYTLAKNSFSDLDNKEMHILFESQDVHQSFGYETTKIIFQNTFGKVKERFVLEGIAVMMDQTNRDYLGMLRQNHFIPLKDLMSVNWELLEGDIKYFEVGVLSQYLVDKYGIDLYINLAKEKEFPEGFTKVYGKSLEEMEEEMIANLQLIE